MSVFRVTGSRGSEYPLFQDIQADVYGEFSSLLNKAEASFRALLQENQALRRESNGAGDQWPPVATPRAQPKDGEQVLPKLGAIRWKSAPARSGSAARMVPSEVKEQPMWRVDTRLWELHQQAEAEDPTSYPPTKLDSWLSMWASLGSRYRSTVDKPQRCWNWADDESCWHWLATSPPFLFFTRMVLILYSVWIGVELDLMPANGVAIGRVTECFFALFAVELLVRFMSYTPRCQAFRHKSFVFDSALVFLMLFETLLPLFLVNQGGGRLHYVGLLRMFRLVRAFRMATALRKLEEFAVIVRGIAKAMRAISVFMAMLLVLNYVVAVAMRVLSEGSQLGQSYFSTVPKAMETLVLDCTLSGARGGVVIHAAIAEDFFLALLLLLFVLVSNVTMMGLLAGVLVQTVRSTADQEREESMVGKIDAAVDSVWEKVTAHDHDGDGLINEHEMQHVIANRDFISSLKFLEVDLQGFMDLSGYMFKQHVGFKNGGGLAKHDFRRMIMDLRGTQQAKVLHHIETRKLICTCMEELLLGKGADREDQNVSSCGICIEETAEKVNDESEGSSRSSLNRMLNKGISSIF